MPRSSPLRVVPGIGWPHLLGVRGYPPSGIEIDGFEGADNRPAQSKAVANDAVDVVDGGDAVADETVRLAEQRPLQPIKDEPLHFASDKRRRQTALKKERLCLRDHACFSKRRRNHLHHFDQKGWISRMHDEASTAPRQAVGDA